MYFISQNKQSFQSFCSWSQVSYNLQVIATISPDAPKDVEKIHYGLHFIFKVAKWELLKNHIDYNYKHKLLNIEHNSTTDKELENII